MNIRTLHVVCCIVAAATAACGKGDKGKTDKAAAVVPTPPTATADAQGAAPQPEKPLFERLGGLPAISMVVDDFIEALVVDDVLNKNPKISAARDKVPPAYLKYHVTALVCQTTGGPCVYDGRSMKDSHAHLAITEAEWQQLAKVFKTILDKYKVPEPEQQELFAIVGTTHDDIVTVK